MPSDNVFLNNPDFTARDVRNTPRRSNQTLYRGEALGDLLTQSGKGEQIGALLGVPSYNEGGKEFNRRSLNLARQGSLQEAFRIRDVNDARYAEAKKFMSANFRENTGPTITDEDINNLFSQSADAINLASQDALASLRDEFGAAGSFSPGLASQLALQKAGQLTSAKRDLRIFKAQQDSEDALRRLQFGQSLGSFMAQGTDETGLYALNEDAGLAASLLGAEYQREAGQDAARASMQAGVLGAIGGLAGGLI